MVKLAKDSIQIPVTRALSHLDAIVIPIASTIGRIYQDMHANGAMVSVSIKMEIKHKAFAKISMPSTN